MHIYTITKKCLVLLLIMAGISFTANAQQNYSFLGTKDTTVIAKSHEELAVYVKLRNNTTDTLEMSWLMLENGFTSNNWDMVALCDPYLCHNTIPDAFSPPFYPNATADSVSEFKLLATPKPSASVSTMRLVVWETGKEHRDTITLTVDARALGIKGNNLSVITDHAPVYPNPAQKVLNFDIETFGYNQIEILSISGQKVLYTNLTGTARTVNIETLPPGLYIARITDRNGVVKTNKFTKQ